MGFAFHETLVSLSARLLLGFAENRSVSLQDCERDWTKYLSSGSTKWPHPDELLNIGNAAFNAFLQANVTGPPLLWDSAVVIFPSIFFNETAHTVESVRKQLISSLSVDGEIIYQLTPNIELFHLAKYILNRIPSSKDPRAVLARLRVNFWHQRMLSEASPTLQKAIYEDVYLLDGLILDPRTKTDSISPAEFLTERATIHLFHGFDRKGRDDLERAAKERSFGFVLTGRLGKRTKFQGKEISQLVVIAKSATLQRNPSSLEVANKPVPNALNLDDDTLLESIAFSSKPKSPIDFEIDEELPPNLRSVDPGNQPLLEPLDAIILLATASSITNTSPTDGLTREETLPYAERALSGGSSNWQVYTQALLVRSRIEGYRSRTIERGVLQLQAVVDQVIAETASSNDTNGLDVAKPVEGTSTSFLPQPKPSDSAPVFVRLRYIHQLASPPRWQLESELAARWVSLGGLRTALEIYERLQMWAEVALCWAANDREDKARDILRRQLYAPVVGIPHDKRLESSGTIDDGDYTVEKDLLPADAPRLLCILGDIEKSVAAYERAWDVSNHRYARAQRSLGRHYSAAGNLPEADEAYSKSLRLNPQDHPTWFAVGCIRLQTENWSGAVDAFGRAVQIKDSDAESWSNLAVALLKLPSDVSSSSTNKQRIIGGDDSLDHHESSNTDVPDSQRHVREAFVALRRAATLKRDSFRIWQNLLSVSIKLSPPPYTDIIVAQTRLIDLLGKLKGEKCVDVEIVEALVAHSILSSSQQSDRAEQTYIDRQLDRQQIEEETSSDSPATRKSGLEKMTIDLVEKKIKPLITSSRRLWLLTAKLSLHLGRPSATLASYEKAWRVTLNQPGWETSGGTQAAKTAWAEVSDSTAELVDAYESLGERKREFGMGAGELVAKDWRFKARSAIRSVLSKARDGWEGSNGYNHLQERLQDLKSA